MANSRLDGPAKAIAEMHRQYDCQWPPQPDFTSWPDSWKPYVEICDAMPCKLHGNDPETPEDSKDPGAKPASKPTFKPTSKPTAFRNWLKNELETKVKLNCVMDDIHRRLRKDDRKLLGFLACLSFLNNAYRWGALPASPKERIRKKLSFPSAIVLPLCEISRLHDVHPIGHVFSINIANTVYVNDRPMHMRFHFNHDPTVLNTEETFFLSFTKSEIIFQRAVMAMKEFMELTEEAKNNEVENDEVKNGEANNDEANNDELKHDEVKKDEVEAISNLEERLKQLTIIHDVLKSLIQVLRQSTSKLDRDNWAKYVQTPATWGLEGKEGASGGETLTFQLLDEFLHVPGESMLYEIKPKRRENMPAIVREVVLAMMTNDPKPRFDSYIGDKETEQLWNKRTDIVNALSIWRMSHKAVVKRILPASEGLASNLEKEMKGAESMVSKVDKQLQERVTETIKEVKKGKVSLPEDAPPSEYRSLTMDNERCEELCECVCDTWVWVSLQDEGGEIRIEPNDGQSQQAAASRCMAATCNFDGMSGPRTFSRSMSLDLSLEVDRELRQHPSERWVWVPSSGLPSRCKDVL